MDLNDIWQEHKRFILGVAAAVVLFFVARGVVGSTFDPGPDLRAAAAARSALARGEFHGAAAVAAARSEHEQLKERLEEARRRLEFLPSEDFDLEGRTGSLEFHYLEVTSRVRDEFRRRADRWNVDLAARDLGLPPASPTDRDEMQRTLTSLDLVETALDRLFSAAEAARRHRADQPHLASIDRITMHGGRGLRRGPVRTAAGPGEGTFEEVTVEMSVRCSYGTLSAFLESCIDPGRPLLLDGLKVEVGPQPGDPLRVSFELVALRVREGA